MRMKRETLFGLPVATGFIVSAFFLVGFSPVLAQVPDPPMPEAPCAVSAAGVLCFLLIGVIMGVCGQVARTVVGIKKELDAAKPDGDKWDSWFNMQELVVSLVIGGGAGALACITMWGDPIDKKFVVACLLAGYAGADFIEGFMTKTAPPDPKAKDPAKEPAAPAQK
jgi:hypothetical protein